MGQVRSLQIRTQVAQCISEIADDLEDVAGELLEIAHAFEGNDDGLTGVVAHLDYLFTLASINNIRLQVSQWEKSATFAQPLRNRGIAAGHEQRILQDCNEVTRLFPKE